MNISGRPARLLAAVSLVACLLPVAASAGPEAPMLLEQDPVPGAKLKKAPAEISFTFSQLIDETHSRIEVYDACGNNIGTGKLAVTLNEMSTSLAKKPRGKYTIFYAAQAQPKGATGETTDTFTITVKKGPVCR